MCREFESRIMSFGRTLSLVVCFLLTSCRFRFAWLGRRLCSKVCTCTGHSKANILQGGFSPTMDVRESSQIAVFSEDSPSILPHIDDWRGTIGRGGALDTHDGLVQALHKNGLPLPDESMSLEDEYRGVLREYVRPARLMFGGMFGEIRDFCDALDELGTVELYILTGRYGLIPSEKRIIPYTAKLRSSCDLEELNDRTRFLDRMTAVTEHADIVVTCFPSDYYIFLTQNEWFRQVSPEVHLEIVVAATIKGRLPTREKMNCYDRVGVARIGGENRRNIMESIEGALGRHS